MNETRMVIQNIYNVRQQWEDGIITTPEMINKVDKAMLDYLIAKGIITVRTNIE